MPLSIRVAKWSRDASPPMVSILNIYYSISNLALSSIAIPFIPLTRCEKFFIEFVDCDEVCLIIFFLDYCELFLDP